MGPARQRVSAGLGDRRAADHPNLGLGLDSFHVLATDTALDALELVDPDKIFLVQLADFMWQEIRSPEERINTARHFRVFPGEGVHSAEVATLVRRLDEMGYRGDYSFEVFNDDYVQLPLAVVAERARASVKWLTGQVPRRSLPMRRTPAVSGKRRRLRRDGRSDTVAGSRPRRRLQQAEWQAWSSSIARYTANLWARGRGCQSRIRIDSIGLADVIRARKVSRPCGRLPLQRRQRLDHGLLPALHLDHENLAVEITPFTPDGATTLRAPAHR